MSRKPNTSRWTVAKYLEEIYYPSRREIRGVELSERTMQWHRFILGKIGTMLGHPPKLREVNADLLERFAKWLYKNGSAKGVPERCCEIMRSIIRHWRPDVFPKPLKTGQPDMKFLDSDIDGTLENVFLHRYLPVRTKIRSQATINSYGKAIRRFSEFLGHTATLDDLTDEICGRFLRWLVDVKGNKAVTANGQFKTIKALWGWCAKKRLVKEFPTIEQLPEPEVVPEAWTLEEMKRLIAACRRRPGTFGGVPACNYWIAFHIFQWDTGERTGAMLGLTWDMLDWKAKTILVPAEVRKGGLKAAVYKPKDVTLTILQQIAEPKRELIFGSDIGKGRSTFYYQYRKLIKSAGLVWVPHKCGPQKMRRSFASHLEALGGNATKALRHTSRLVTEQSYLDPRISDTVSPNLMLPSLFETPELKVG